MPQAADRRTSNSGLQVRQEAIARQMVDGERVHRTYQAAQVRHEGGEAVNVTRHCCVTCPAATCRAAAALRFSFWALERRTG